MESAQSTNTGNKRIESLLAQAIRGGKRALALLGLLQNRTAVTTISGTVVAGGSALVSASFTAQYSGKVRLSWFASWAAPGAVTVTPFIAISGTRSQTLIAFAQTGNVVGDLGGSMEFDNFPIGSAETINLTTTSGDGSITLGQGAAVAGAGLTIEELP